MSQSGCVCKAWFESVIVPRDYSYYYSHHKHSFTDWAQICCKFATLTDESGQTNVILQYKLMALILSAVCSVIQ